MRQEGRAPSAFDERRKGVTIAGGLAANNNAKLVSHLGHTVSITGDVVAKGDRSTISSWPVMESK